MSDHGEKIVFLAREILSAGLPSDSQPRAPKSRIMMSFKTLCFTTFLAAAGGGMVASWAHEDERPLNRFEKTEIQALIFYAAKVKGLDEDYLRRQVEHETGVARLDDLTAGDFPLARRFLQEKAQ